VPRLWRIWLWKDPAIEQRVLDQGCISLSRDDLGDVIGIEDAELERRIRNSQPGRADGAYPQFVRYWRRFLDMRPGDYVVIALSGARVTAARVIGDFEQHLEESEPELRYRRRIELLLDEPRAKETLPRELEKRRDLPATLIRISYPSSVQEFLDWIGDA
jgi:hypothetical protein